MEPDCQGGSLQQRMSVVKTLVIGEQDMGVVFGLADRSSVLVYGEIIATGTPGESRSSAAVQEAYLGTGASGCWKSGICTRTMEKAILFKA